MPENRPQNARKNTVRTPRDIAKQMATRIENRLMAFVTADAFTEPAPIEEGKKPPKSKLMTGEQVHAALGLLKKYKPDLKSIEFVGEVAHDHVHRIEVEIIDPQTPSGESVSAAAEPE